MFSKPKKPEKTEGQKSAEAAAARHSKRPTGLRTPWTMENVCEANGHKTGKDC